MMMKVQVKNMVIAILLNGIFGLKVSEAQDIQFSQFYAAPLYLNPALTGNTEQFRVAGNYRNQWPKIPGFTSYTFAYDQNIRKINSGVGLLITHDQAGTAGLRFTNIGATYAFKFPITRTLFSSLGARASYTTRAINADQLIFWDQIVRDDPTASVENIPREVVKYLDFSVGYILYSKSLWFGLALDHLTTPNQSFIGQQTLLPLKYTFHGGYRLAIAKTVKGEVTRSLSLTANYKGQLEWDQFDIGAYLNIDGIVGGMWYRGIPGLKAYKPGYSNHDALVFLVGYQVKDMISVGYSYDLTISKLTVASGGSHEISLIYEYAQPKYKRDNVKKNFMMPCMKF